MTQNYHTLKNSSILVPATSADLGTPCQPFGNIYVKNNVSLGAGNGIANITSFSATSLAVPKIQSITYPNTETAANPAGGETITINGSGFLTGLGVYVNNVLMNTSTVVSSNQITFTSPALAAGNYPLSVVNSDGGSATYLFGITYTNVPTWTTAAGSLGIAREGNAISTSVAATDNAQTITYSVTSGALPSGLTLASNGAITGTLANSASGNTTYNFTLGAADPQNQVVTRNFSYTVVGDTLAWSSPSANTVFTESSGVAISNIALSATSTFGASITYSSSNLPTGLSISGSNITGTPTTVANTSSIISATTSTKQANISLAFNVQPGPYTINYMAVGGGGGGGYYAGGGAGGVLRSGSYSTSSGVSYVVVVAGGGSGSNSTAIPTNPGGTSNITYSSTTLVSASGGGGGIKAVCGGSAAGGSNADHSGGSGETSAPWATGGGAGAGANGTSGSGSGGFGVPGNGGAGATWSVNGVTYGGGGGGTVYTGNGKACFGTGAQGGQGGSGGGGTGHPSGGSYAGNGGAGAAGYGGGGGAGQVGASGGSGVVIISYQSATQIGSGGTVTSTGSGASTIWYHTYTTTGTFSYTS